MFWSPNYENKITFVMFRKIKIAENRIIVSAGLSLNSITGNNSIIFTKQSHAKRPQRDMERETKSFREDAERDCQDYIALSPT